MDRLAERITPDSIMMVVELPDKQRPKRVQNQGLLPQRTANLAKHPSLVLAGGHDRLTSVDYLKILLSEHDAMRLQVIPNTLVRTTVSRDHDLDQIDGMENREIQEEQRRTGIREIDCYFLKFCFVIFLILLLFFLR